jgi:hypothetical protein
VRRGYYRTEQVIVACSLALMGLAVALGILARQIDRAVRLPVGAR